MRGASLPAHALGNVCSGISPIENTMIIAYWRSTSSASSAYWHKSNFEDKLLFFFWAEEETSPLDCIAHCAAMAESPQPRFFRCFKVVGTMAMRFKHSLVEDIGLACRRSTVLLATHFALTLPDTSYVLGSMRLMRHRLTQARLSHPLKK